MWALESHRWQIGLRETSVNNSSKHTLSPFIYASESTKHVSEIFVFQWNDSLVTARRPPPFPPLISIFCFIVFAYAFFSFLDCKQRQQERPPVRQGQPVQAATGKDNKREVNLHFIPLPEWWRIIFCIVYLPFFLTSSSPSLFCFFFFCRNVVSHTKYF